MNSFRIQYNPLRYLIRIFPSYFFENIAPDKEVVNLLDIRSHISHNEYSLMEAGYQLFPL